MNASCITWSVDDVRIRLGQLVPGPGSMPVAEERVAVTFSWRQTKIFRDQLSTLIGAFEEANGKIDTEGVLPQVGEFPHTLTVPRKP